MYGCGTTVKHLHMLHLKLPIWMVNFAYTRLYISLDSLFFHILKASLIQNINEIFRQKRITRSEEFMF